MATYLSHSQELLRKISSWKITHVDRGENQWADALSKLASSILPSNSDPIYVEERHTPSINDFCIHEVHEGTDWRTPFIDYILYDKLPEDKNEARSLVFKARNYCEVNGKLYRRSLVEPLLRCLDTNEANLAIVEVHSGICGDHLGGKNLALKIIRQGLFWPTMRKDCEEYVKKCRACQVHGQVNHRPTTSLMPVINPCPFFQWGIDIVGPFQKSKNQAKFIVVAVDYATKLIEAKPLARIREKEMIQFLMEFIVFRFGVPRIVVTDNGTQFVGEDFTGTLEQLKIKHIKASVAYPQSNGQVEVSNRTILQGLKKRIEETPSSWVDELPNVLWSYRTTPRSATGESPFRMALAWKQSRQLRSVSHL